LRPHRPPLCAPVTHTLQQIRPFQLGKSRLLDRPSVA
jgi:hypothetical protein